MVLTVQELYWGTQWLPSLGKSGNVTLPDGHQVTPRPLVIMSCKEDQLRDATAALDACDCAYKVIGLSHLKKRVGIGARPASVVGGGWVVFVWASPSLVPPEPRLGTPRNGNKLCVNQMIPPRSPVGLAHMGCLAQVNVPGP